jgi:hypothetical protein
MMKSSVDNRSGAYSIRMQISDLTTLISKLGYDIEKFNHKVKGLMEDLNRRGETSDDVIFNVIKAYKEVPVKEFVAFVDRLKDEADDKDDDEQYTPQFVMDKAENKFKILVNEKSWNPGSSDQDAILALKAEINKLKKQHKGKDQKGPRKKPGKGKKVVDITRKPKDINKPVKIDGKEWWWCSKETGGKCTGVLRRHKPSACEGLAAKPSAEKKSKREDEAPEEKKKRLKIDAQVALLKAQGYKSDSDVTREDFNMSPE